MSRPPPNTGRITRWQDERGFGFITPDSGGDEIFVHISAFANRTRRPRNDEAVTYQVSTDPGGRRKARRAAYVADQATKPTVAAQSLARALILSGSYLSGVVALTLAGLLPSIVFLVYLIASTVTFVVYAWDKSSARNNRYRTPENILHLLGLLGGWPGALIARQLFRHKSKKQSFIIEFWITAMLNVGAVAMLAAPSGKQFLQSMLAAM